MQQRITTPAKWSDKWFLNLRPIPKIFFVYCYENCDDAGFIELNVDIIAKQIAVLPSAIQQAIKDCEKAFVRSDIDPDKIWIKNFLKHQNRLPLSKKAKLDKPIIDILISNYGKGFSMCLEIGEILKQSATATSAKGGRFVAPTEQDYINKAISLGKDQHWATNLYNHYKQVGWITKGGTPIVDWEATITMAISREKQKERQNASVNGSKIQKAVSLSQTIIENLS